MPTDARSDAFTQAVHQDSTYYLLGRSTGREESRTVGSIFTGVVFGIGMPFVGGATASAAHQASGKYGDLSGLLAGISSAALWSWSGSKLNRLSAIGVPDEHITGLNNTESAAFSEGYCDGYDAQRRLHYTGGVIVGTLIPIIAALYILSQITTIGGV